ncbi:transcriptional regulator, MucR family [Arboricoccus pini]|uniref:Transcriptional regulator, MucR family n=1 Tax=Arboricoccus pini TaxID=1963835 RepID=A0A212RH70_9PROT|nr:MucR family transcriptional regulator [Arboricoccus pini]SNB71610.1 transcriptional regulator, MucR family [Arboricoccus pini]
MSEPNEKSPIDHKELLTQTTDIVASYVANNSVDINDLSSLITGVFASLQAQGREPEPGPAPQLLPAVPIKKSVHRDFIICLEDGKKLKTLKRHLRIRYNLTPADYRRKWGLPPDYPMVAPSYAERRSELALKIGLGRTVAADEVEEVSPPPARPTRRKAEANATVSLAAPASKRQVAARRPPRQSS